MAAGRAVSSPVKLLGPRCNKIAKRVANEEKWLFADELSGHIVIIGRLDSSTQAVNSNKYNHSDRIGYSVAQYIVATPVFAGAFRNGEGVRRVAASSERHHVYLSARLHLGCRWGEIMNHRYTIGAVVGLVVGIIAGILFRPALPILGQPPVNDALAALFGAGGEDFGYGGQFRLALFLFVLGGVALGLGAAYVVEKTSPKVAR